MSTQPTLNSRRPNDIIRIWEESSARLDSALTHYFGCCTHLDKYPLLNSRTKEDLVSRMDKHLDALHHRMEKHLLGARLALAKTRNNLVAKLFTIPREIKVEIFMHVLKDNVKPPALVYPEVVMRDQIILFYRRLSILLHVCLDWRQTIQSTQKFWSFLLFFTDREQSNKIVAPMSIDYWAQRSDLELAVNHVHASISQMPNLLKYPQCFSRLRSVNVFSHSSQAAHKFLHDLSAGIPLAGSVSELSVCVSRCRQAVGFSVPDLEFPTLNTLLSKLKDSLTALRIGGVNLTLGADMWFSRLIDLRIQDVVLMAGAESLLATINAAPFLRVLRIITVSTLASPLAKEIDYTIKFSPKTDNLVILPYLEELYLEDLFLDLTNILVHSIASDSCRLILNLTNRIAFVRQPAGNKLVGSQHTVFQDVDIAELYLSGNPDTGVPDATNLLKSMSLLRQLHLDSWGPGSETWTQLIRQPTAPGLRIPLLEKLFLTRATFNSLEDLFKVAESHSLQHLALGGQIRNPEDNSFQPIDSMDLTVLRLEGVIPSFSLTSPTILPTQSTVRLWRLWW